MWQNINLTNYVGPLLIDNQTVKFNLSGWLGGYSYEDDNVVVSMTFTDQANQIVGNETSIGPVLSSDRNNITSLLFRQASGIVPVGARFLKVLVTLVRLVGLLNNGDVDNIAVVLHQ